LKDVIPTQSHIIVPCQTKCEKDVVSYHGTVG